MATVHLRRLIEKYGFDHKNIRNESYKKLVTDILTNNTELLQKKIARQNNDFFNQKATGKFKDIKTPDISTIIPKSMKARKLAERGQLLTDTLRNKLTADLRQVLEKPEYIYKRGQLKGTLKQQAIDDFKVKIQDTLKKYKTSNIETIARTETIGAVNQVKQNYMEEFQDRNDDTEVIKIWRHGKSKNPRPHHLEMDGVSIGINDLFVLFDKETKKVIKTPYPHWDNLPPSESINCVCQCQYEMRKKEPSQGIYEKK
jgi:hypothetical protein